MLKKKDGIINEIIYKNTVYNNDKFRFYPTILDFKRIVKEIINSESTTEYLRFTPFYINAKLNFQIEFEDYMFFIECRNEVNEEDKLELIKESIENTEFSDARKAEVGKILYSLCNYSDVEKFGKSLEEYLNYLDSFILEMMEIVIEKGNLSKETLPFGYFCFEIHSG